MTKEEMYNIKKNGKLLAFENREESGWQYWEYSGIIYSINADNDPSRTSIWCSINRLNRHLHHLWQICGYKHFTEDEDMVIVDKERIAQFEWA